ncbi:MAG TPA: TetR/AcrR family transcriptional regulator [Pyrinomonadaceae bacterium]|jgi:AcrR family transcriptional regulator
MNKQISAQTGQPPVAGSRMAGEERRQQIVRIAMNLFSRRGFRGTTTREIAQAAGISEAMVFRHFATKKELYTAILDSKACAGGMTDICRQVKDTTEQSINCDDDRAVFESLARAILSHHESDEEFLRLLLYSALEGHELHEMFWDRNVREMATLLRGYISERQKAGTIRGVDTTVAGRAFIGMLIYHSLVNLLFDKGHSLLDIPSERAAREFTDILLRGIAVTEPPRETARRAVSSNKVIAKKKQSR